MNIEFKKNIPHIKKMLSEGKNLEQISESLGLGSKGLLTQLRKNSNDFSDLNFIKNK